MPLELGYRESSEEERNGVWDAVIAASAVIPGSAGGLISAVLGTGLAAKIFFCSKIKRSKRAKEIDTQLRNELIPTLMTEDQVSLAVYSIKTYIAGAKKEKEQLSIFYTQNMEAEFADLLFDKCCRAFIILPFDEDEYESEKVLRQFCVGFAKILLNLENVILYTEQGQIVSDTMESARTTNREVKEHRIILNKVLNELKSLHDPYAMCVNRNRLRPNPKAHRFSFLNTRIRFQGRKKELDILNEWINNNGEGVSFLAITGKGGCGKSRLAFELDISNKKKLKTVWLDDAILDKLSGIDNYSYSQTVLFICDYSAQYEKKVSDLINRMSRYQANAIFILLERSSVWYFNFLEQHDSISTLKHREEPIDLNNSILDKQDEGYIKILDDYSKVHSKKEHSKKKRIPSDKKQEIIQIAKNLSGDSGSVRCLFLLMVADAYLSNDPISSIVPEKLAKKYIRRSRELVTNRYTAKYNEKDGEDIVDAGYHVLAYATACNGIKWCDEHSAIQADLHFLIKEFFKNKPKKIDFFFSQLSETYKSGLIAPLKPDFIGEYLFLSELRGFEDKWIPQLLLQEYSKEFLARCLTNWHNAGSERLCKAIKDIIVEGQADDLTNYCAEVFGKAFQKSNSDVERQKYFNIIEEFSNCGSLPFILQHAIALQYMIKKSSNRPRPAWEFDPEEKEDSQDESDDE